jgi:hypothetical protein
LGFSRWSAGRWSRGEYKYGVVNIFKNVGYKPKNTLRVVLFMNEENGNRGGLKYGELAEANKEKHIFALESDSGGFSPWIFFRM